MRRRKLPDSDIDRVVKIIAFALVIGAIGLLLEAIITIATSPLFWITAIPLGVLAIVLWTRR